MTLPTDPNTIDLIAAASRLVRQRMRSALDPLDLAPAAARALRVIGSADDAIRMSELAQRLRIERRSATDVVDALVERGLIERLADPHDKRATAVALTSTGDETLATITKIRAAVEADLTASLSEAETTTLRRALATLIDHGRTPTC